MMQLTSKLLFCLLLCGPFIQAADDETKTTDQYLTEILSEDKDQQQAAIDELRKMGASAIDAFLSQYADSFQNASAEVQAQLHQSLDQIAQQQELKKALWQQLKQLFPV